MGHSHSEDGQLVRFAGERATGGHHVTKFIDVRGHLVPPSSLNLTVAFSMKKSKIHCFNFNTLFFFFTLFRFETFKHDETYEKLAPIQIKIYRRGSIITVLNIIVLLFIIQYHNIS